MIREGLPYSTSILLPSTNKGVLPCTTVIRLPFSVSITYSIPVCFVAEASSAAPVSPPTTAPPIAPTIFARVPPPIADPAAAPAAVPAAPPKADVPRISTGRALMIVPAIDPSHLSTFEGNIGRESSMLSNACKNCVILFCTARFIDSRARTTPTKA